MRIARPGSELVSKHHPAQPNNGTVKVIANAVLLGRTPQQNMLEAFHLIYKCKSFSSEHSFIWSSIMETKTVC